MYHLNGPRKSCKKKFTQKNRPSVPRLLFFVLNDKRGQTVWLHYMKKMQKNMEMKIKIDQMSKDVGERKKNIMCLKKGQNDAG